MLQIFDAAYIVATTQRKDYIQPLIERLIQLKAKNINTWWTGPEVEGIVNKWTDEPKPKNWEGRPQSWNYWNCLWGIISDANNNSYEQILYLEDDADLRPNFENVFPFVWEDLQKRPIKWDLLYLGGNHHNSITYRLTDFLLRCTDTLDLHTVAINKTIYNRLLETKYDNSIYNSKNWYADGYIANHIHKTHNVYASCPAISWQRDGWSGNENRYMSRQSNWQHNGREIDIRKK